MERLTIRTVLIVGFGLTVGLGTLSSYSFVRRVSQARSDAERINERYNRAQDLLSSIQTQVLLGAIDVRDVLLDANRTATVDYRRHLETMLESLDVALRQYEPILDADTERGLIAQLHRQTSDFKQVILEVLSVDTALAPRDARVLLRNRIIPKREAVINVSKEVASLNRDALGRRRAAIAEVYRQTKLWTWVQLGLALVASIVIGLVATHRVGTLESALRQQQARDAAASRDLQRLSSQLLTVQEDERRVIARELHDEIGQVLSAIKVELTLAERKLEGGGASGVVLRDARAVTERAIHSVRDLSHLLHPATLDDLGLAAAIETLVRDFRRRHDIATDFTNERMAVRLPQPVEVASYRIVQESLTNVAKHARATSCHVHVRCMDDGVLIVVEDDGAGFDVAARLAPGARSGLGLLGMRERVAQLNGRIQFESSPGRGSRVVAVLPTRGGSFSRRGADGAGVADGGRHG